jgi:hypothetical protein
MIRYGVSCLALVVFLLLGVTGCGGAPKTGETANVSSGSEEKKKSMLEDYKKKMAEQKGHAKVKKA